MMDWVKQVNEAIDYIESHLREEISYEKLGRIAGCSSYNFQRTFSYIFDMSLSEYIRKRRLTAAAFDLLNSEERILDIAMKYGYSSQDSFTRAFKAFHKTLPSTARNEIVQLNSCPKLSFQVNIEGEYKMKYKVEDFPAFKVAGKVTRIETGKAFEIVPKLWDKAWQDGTMNQLFELHQKTDYRPEGLLGIVSGDEAGDSEEMDYIIGVANYVDDVRCTYVAPPEGMEELAYPASKWVVFEANGKLPESIQQVYKRFHKEWLPKSGYRLANLPVIECYKQNDQQDIWFPILSS